MLAASRSRAAPPRLQRDPDPRKGPSREEKLREALKDSAAKHGKTSEQYLDALSEFAELLASEGRYKEADLYYYELNDVIFRRLNEGFKIRSEDERARFWKKLYDLTSRFTGYATLRMDTVERMKQEALAVNLAIKGSLLATTVKIKQLTRDHKDPKVKAMYERWAKLKAELASLQSRIALRGGSEADKKRAEILKNETDELERKLAAEAAKFGDLVEFKGSYATEQKTIEELKRLYKEQYELKKAKPVTP